jgi:hypothetical protein
VCALLSLAGVRGFADLRKAAIMKEFHLTAELPLDLTAFFSHFLADGTEASLSSSSPASASTLFASSGSPTASPSSSATDFSAGPTFFSNYYRRCGHVKVHVSDWIPLDENSASRVCSYTLTDNGDSGTSDGRCMENQWFVVHAVYPPTHPLAGTPVLPAQQPQSQQQQQQQQQPPQRHWLNSDQHLTSRQETGGHVSEEDMLALGALQELSLHCSTTPMAPGGNHFRIETTWDLRPVTRTTDLSRCVRQRGDMAVVEEACREGLLQLQGDGEHLLADTPALMLEVRGVVACKLDLWGVQGLAERVVLRRVRVLFCVVDCGGVAG